MATTRTIFLIAALVVGAPSCTFGAEVDSGAGPVDSPRQDTLSPATGPVLTVAEGTFEGQAWTLTAYRSRDRICEELTIADDRTGHCTVGSIEGINDATHGWTDDLPDWQEVHGEVGAEIEELEAHYEGESQWIDLYAVSSLDRTFFVAFFPKEGNGELIARDEQGRIVDKAKIRPFDL